MEKEENVPKERTIYEVGYLLDPAIGEEDLGPAVVEIKDAIEKYDVKVLSEGWPKGIILSYTIEVSKDEGKKQFDSASFGWLKYEINPSDIELINKSLSSNNNIVRFLIMTANRENFVPFKPKHGSISQKEEKKPISISKEELDKTIEELVIE